MAIKIMLDAHYKCKQFLVPIYGSMIIEYENFKIKKKN